jgi:hypothetical protein
MSRNQALLFCLAIAFVSFAATASEKPSDEYVKAMRSLDDAADGLKEAISAADPAEMDKYVIIARSALSVVEKYWTERKVEDAIASAGNASAALSEISVAQYLMSLTPNVLAQEGAELALGKLLAACAACHKAHREELQDGSYRIK